MMRTVPAFTLALLACAIASGANLGVFVIAGASREQGTALLNLFYPITIISGWG